MKSSMGLSILTAPPMLLCFRYLPRYRDKIVGILLKLPGVLPTLIYLSSIHACTRRRTMSRWGARLQNFLLTVSTSVSISIYIAIRGRGARPGVNKHDNSALINSDDFTSPYLTNLPEEMPPISVVHLCFAQHAFQGFYADRKVHNYSG